MRERERERASERKRDRERDRKRRIGRNTHTYPSVYPIESVWPLLALGRSIGGASHKRVSEVISRGVIPHSGVALGKRALAKARVKIAVCRAVADAFSRFPTVNAVIAVQERIPRVETCGRDVRGGMHQVVQLPTDDDGKYQRSEKFTGFLGAIPVCNVGRHTCTH